jgi:hypothetical protein
MFHIILRGPARCIAALAARGRIVVPYREVAKDLNMMWHSDSESAGNKPDADRGLSKTRPIGRVHLEHIQYHGTWHWHT